VVTAQSPKREVLSVDYAHSIGLHNRGVLTSTLEYNFRALRWLEIKAEGGWNKYKATDLSDLTWSRYTGSFAGLGLSIYSSEVNKHHKEKVQRGWLVSVISGHGNMAIEAERLYEGITYEDRTYQYSDELKFSYFNFRIGYEWIWPSGLRLDVYPLELAWSETESRFPYVINYFSASGRQDNGPIKLGIGLHYQFLKHEKTTD
jgi:hypothetical protein